jgi:ABC-type Mn2+/Zn2+ transport system permease subunit
METLREILAPDFLLRNSIYVSLLVGFICPVLGVFLVLRRLVFLGVALPQVSSAGVAFALSLHILSGHDSMFHDTNQQHIAFAGSLIFTLVTIVALAWAERLGKGLREGGLGALYVLSMAGSILMLAKCPQAERGWLNLFRGEIIAISGTDVLITLITFVSALAAIILFSKELLLVSYDREMAITLRKKIFAWDLLLYVLIGLVIAVAVLTVGPLVAFGFMVIPPLIARRLARNMRQFFGIASLLGGVSSFVGFWIAYRFDLPVGPTDITLLGALLLLSGGFWIVRRH